MPRPCRTLRSSAAVFASSRSMSATTSLRTSRRFRTSSDQCLSVIHETWTIDEHPTLLPAYALWRLNWIHPFIEGNGRTARAACYLLICLRQGRLLPGRKIVPERIQEDRQPYYAALEAADRAWADGQFNVNELALYLARLLTEQLRDV